MKPTFRGRFFLFLSQCLGLPPKGKERMYAADTSRLAVSLSAFWWFASLLLISLSLVLLHATWTGKEVGFWIGRRTATRHGEIHNQQRQPSQQPNIVVGYIGFLTGLMIIVILVSRTTLTLRMLSG